MLNRHKTDNPFMTLSSLSATYMTVNDTTLNGFRYISRYVLDNILDCTDTEEASEMLAQVGHG